MLKGQMVRERLGTPALTDELEKCTRERIRENAYYEKDESRAQSADSSKAYRTPSACLLQMIFCDSGYLHNEHKARHEAKVYEQ